MKLIATILMAFLIPAQALAMHVRSPMIRLDLNTQKVLILAGMVDEGMVLSAKLQMQSTSTLQGPRVVIINSPGGSLQEGDKIIAMLNAERRMGVKTVCVVQENAHSMAFNIMTQACDVRLATTGSTMVVHKAAMGPGMCEFGPGPRCTAKNLRDLAKVMERDDERNTRLNAAAMHMSRPEYDHYADAETRWQALTLIVRHYLNGMAFLSP